MAGSGDGTVEGGTCLQSRGQGAMSPHVARTHGTVGGRIGGQGADREPQPAGGQRFRGPPAPQHLQPTPRPPAKTPVLSLDLVEARDWNFSTRCWRCVQGYVFTSESREVGDGTCFRPPATPPRSGGFPF